MYAGLARVGLVRGDDRDAWRIAAALFLIGWLPVLALSLAARATTGAWPPIALNLVHHARWIVAVPALLASTQILDVEVGRALASLRAASLVRGGDAALRALTRRAERAASRWGLELGLAVVAVAPALLALPLHDAADGWNQLIGLPLFRFGMLLWLARWIAWSVMVARLVRLGLAPVASHPDRRGGLGRLGTPTRALGAGLFGLGALVAAWLLQPPGRATDASTTSWLLAYVAWALALGSLPGLPLVRLLWSARRDALDAWGATACQHDRAFEERWLVRNAAHALGAPEISSTADLGSAHGAVESTTFAPLTREQLTQILIAALAPLLPVALTFVPLVEILKFLIGLRP